MDNSHLRRSRSSSHDTMSYEAKVDVEVDSHHVEKKFRRASKSSESSSKIKIPHVFAAETEVTFEIKTPKVKKVVKPYTVYVPIFNNREIESKRSGVQSNLSP